MKTTRELVQIAAAGGGFSLSAKAKTTVQLTQIAAAASGHRARIVIRDAGVKTTRELMQIASAGQGCVSFELE